MSPWAMSFFSCSSKEMKSAAFSIVGIESMPVKLPAHRAGHL
jgi:hypothetical protein